jgi:hypothetical protein
MSGERVTTDHTLTRQLPPYHAGEASCTIVGPHHGVVVFKSGVGFDRAVGADPLGGSVGIFEAAGAKDVQ